MDDLGIHFAQPANVEAQQVRVHVLAVRPLRQEFGRAQEIIQDAGQDLRRHTQLRARADQDQARQPRRIAQGEFKGDRTAHRVPGQDECRQIKGFGEVAHDISVRADLSPPRAARLAVSWQIERVDRAPRQPPQLARPVHQIAARAMHEHQRRTFRSRRAVMELVVELFAIDDDGGHGNFSPEIGSWCVVRVTCSVFSR